MVSSRSGNFRRVFLIGSSPAEGGLGLPRAANIGLGSDRQDQDLRRLVTAGLSWGASHRRASWGGGGANEKTVTACPRVEAASGSGSSVDDDGFANVRGVDFLSYRHSVVLISD
jgi:hypothetical protein